MEKLIFSEGKELVLKIEKSAQAIMFDFRKTQLRSELIKLMILIQSERFCIPDTRMKPESIFRNS